MPAAIASSMAATPSRVAGIFTMRFGRLTARQTSAASRIVAGRVVRERRVDLDAHVAVGALRAPHRAGANTSAAALMSSIMSASTMVGGGFAGTDAASASAAS